MAIRSVTVRGWVLESQLLTQSLWTSDTSCVPCIGGKMRTGRRNVSQPQHLHFPTAYLWHLSGWTAVCFTSGPSLCQQKEGDKEIPCYALQCFPEKPHPCTWDEAEESQGRAFTTQHQQVQKAETSMGVRMNGGAGSCKGILCFQVSPFDLEEPGRSISPCETRGLKSLRK